MILLGVSVMTLVLGDFCEEHKRSMRITGRSEEEPKGSDCQHIFTK